MCELKDNKEKTNLRDKSLIIPDSEYSMKVEFILAHLHLTDNSDRKSLPEYVTTHAQVSHF